MNQTSGFRLPGIVVLLLALLIAVPAGVIFQSMHERELIVTGPGVTEMRMLSDYVPEMKDTPADTPVYILEGKEPGGTMLVFGGTHPQEVSGLLAAIITIENAQVEKGRLIVIPQANQSGFTYTEPLQGFPHRFEIDTPFGTRWFRNGMRLTNPIHEWPDPDIYVHRQSAEHLVGWEGRNLNRAYPGHPEGTYTQQLAAALLDVAEQEQADIVLDLHEAYPEYPIINMLVAHERAFEIATLAMLGLQSEGMSMDLMPSPKGLRGLSHREFGDSLEHAHAILAETANPAMGRLRGRTDAELVVEGKDENYVKAAQQGRLFVPFTEEGHPLSERTARQLATILHIIEGYNLTTDGEIVVADLPGYADVLENGLGVYLRQP